MKYKRLVAEEQLLDAWRDVWIDGRAAPQVGTHCTTHGGGAEIDVTAVRDDLGHAVRPFSAVTPDRRADSDADAVIVLRRRLDGVTRRVASDKYFWAWLTVHAGWAYSQWRWSKAKAAGGRERLFGVPARSALGRLWWAGELVRPVSSSGEGALDDAWEARVRVLCKNAETALFMDAPGLIRGHDVRDAVFDVIVTPGRVYNEDRWRLFKNTMRRRISVLVPGTLSEVEMKALAHRVAAETWPVQ